MQEMVDLEEQVNSMSMKKKKPNLSQSNKKNKSKKRKTIFSVAYPNELRFIIIRD